MKNFTIGVLGGMGTYATIHLFQQYADVFVAEKEWDRPRIIIDNRCTMPSRVRAFLYNEKVDQLVDEMTDSMQHLVDFGCNKIILACNTSHLFLPKIYKNIPDLEPKVLNIIKTCVEIIAVDKLKTIYLIASEGTIESKIYQNELNGKGIKCLTPDINEYNLLRKCIEAVKQNKYTEEVKNIFLKLINRNDACILGCTELPILYEKYHDFIKCKNVYDPLYLSLCKLKEEYDNE
jgi:aspartate racemase